MMTSADLYVALHGNTGDISLVFSTTNGEARDGRSTTVFGVSCMGSLVIE